MPRDDLKAIGTDYGGWVIPEKLLDSNSICYCVGCGEDISFDLGLIDQFGCRVFGFDPTPRAIKYAKEHAAQYEKYYFSEVGLWDKEDILKFYAPTNPEHVSHSLIDRQKTQEYFLAKVKRLSDIMRENGHKTLALLKLDIEGAEYKVINSIIEDNIDIKILCIEYDEWLNPLDNNYKNRIKGSISKIIEAGYSLVWSQQNGNYTFVKNALGGNLRR
ncbi:MAG: FkbM family methyltransferase [Gammaproteobacteria bacterium]